VNDIPWLDVVNRRGSGTLADVATVQRINSHGGAAQGACDQAGAFRSVPYSADYFPQRAQMAAMAQAT
jgi:hypothetical protein